MIISWDIGIYNLSYCILEKINNSNNINLNNNNLNNINELNNNNLNNNELNNNNINNNELNNNNINNNELNNNGINNKIGLKNEIINFNEYKINDWGIINIADKINIKKNKKSVYENIPDILDKYTNFLNCEYVLIENQPCMKNPTMKTIQIILYSYFLIKGLKSDKSNIHTIEFISPMNKFRLVSLK